MVYYGKNQEKSGQEEKIISFSSDTIVATATPSGRGGIGIVRISGSFSSIEEIAKQIIGYLPHPRSADFVNFFSPTKSIIDHGIVLYFCAPHSFTGESILEFQVHGSPFVLDQLIQGVLENNNTRLARPGEFSERAFLNNKIDLVQAEAIADLIDAHSEKAARAAIRSLTGEFSTRIYQLVENIVTLRMWIEAAIDFVEEEIDFLRDEKIMQQLNALLKQMAEIKGSAQQGSLLREGYHVVIVGLPNVGKSSLLNRLSGLEKAIVTDIPGTTRDVLTETIQIEGVPLTIIDTAGLRFTKDVIEKEGIRRAIAEVEKADLLLVVVDENNSEFLLNDFLASSFFNKRKIRVPVCVVYNKIDLYHKKAAFFEKDNITYIKLSAKTGEGMDYLRTALKKNIGYQETEGIFLARRRHLDALKEAENFIIIGKKELENSNAGDLLAENLRLAQKVLGEITGEFSTDALLGRIFSSFCIGK